MSERDRSKPVFETPADTQVRFGKPPAGWRLSMHKVVFESDTPAGRVFDLVLIAAILASVAVVVADSMPNLGRRHRTTFEILEWGFTVLFTVEYIARLLCVRYPLRYATSLFGVIDLVAVLPTYLAFFFPDLHALIDVRILRLLRIFRILKMGAYIAEYSALGSALAASRRKIFVFLSFVDPRRPRDGHVDVRGRRAGERLHEHPDRHVLGRRDDDDGRLRRHHAEDRARSAASPRSRCCSAGASWRCRPASSAPSSRAQYFRRDPSAGARVCTRCASTGHEPRRRVLQGLRRAVADGARRQRLRLNQKMSGSPVAGPNCVCRKSMSQPSLACRMCSVNIQP